MALAAEGGRQLDMGRPAELADGLDPVELVTAGDERFGVARRDVAAVVDAYQTRVQQERERTMADLYARNEALQKKARAAR